MIPASTTEAPRRQPWRFRLAAAGTIAIFIALLVPYWSNSTGLTSLINIGEKSGPPVEAMRKVPHHVFKDSWGYDGMYYAQLALHPSLRDPALKDTIDNLPYRGRRILMPWLAHLAGLGRPFWILQAYALINIICWLGVAAMLWRWLPATGWENWYRWTAVLFSHGACLSVQMSLTDLPGMALLLLAFLLLEQGRRSGAIASLAAAVLCKETSLIAAGLLYEGRPDGSKRWLRLGLQTLLVLLPFLCWLAYLRWGLGLEEAQGTQNFGWPLAGLLQRWIQIIPDLFSSGDFLLLKIGTLLTLLSITLQIAFLLGRWQPKNPWWRLGAPFALLALFVAAPVWEGYPGAASRVLLPMTLAFNLLLPRGRKWLLLLVLGNLSILSAVLQLRTTPAEFMIIRSQGWGLAPVWEAGSQGWYGEERNRSHHWCWSSSEGVLRLASRSPHPLKAFLRGRSSALTKRCLSIRAASELVCRKELPSIRHVSFETAIFEIPAQGLELRFISDRPAVQPASADRRDLAFRIEDLELVLVE